MCFVWSGVYKTIYSVLNICRLVTLLFFLIKKILFNYLDSPYLTYLIGLNNWNWNFISNFLIVLVIGFLSFSNLIKNIFYFKVITLLLVFFKNIYCSTCDYTSLLLTLWIGTIGIHPFFLYLFIIFLLNYLLNFLKFFFIHKSFFSIYFCLLSGIIALALGGLWGVQSFTWGFIWSNDGIEWVLFLLILICIIIIHMPLIKSYFFIYLFIYLFLMLLLLFIRLNLLTTRHSFIASTNFIITVYYLYFIVLQMVTQNIKNLFFEQKIVIKLFLPILFYSIVISFKLSISFFSFFSLYITIISCYFIFQIPRYFSYLFHIFLFVYFLLWIRNYPLFLGSFYLSSLYAPTVKFTIYTLFSNKFLYASYLKNLFLLEKILFIQNLGWSRFYSYLTLFSIKISIINYYYYYFTFLIIYLVII